jgi:hypothetical protein
VREEEEEEEEEEEGCNDVPLLHQCQFIQA